MKIIICDKCKKTSENPIRDRFCKVLIYEGLGFQTKSRGSKYKHYHFCNNCKKKLLIKCKGVKR